MEKSQLLHVGHNVCIHFTKDKFRNCKCKLGSKSVSLLLRLAWRNKHSLSVMHAKCRMCVFCTTFYELNNYRKVFTVLEKSFNFFHSKRKSRIFFRFFWSVCFFVLPIGFTTIISLETTEKNFSQHELLSTCKISILCSFLLRFYQVFPTKNCWRFFPLSSRLFCFLPSKSCICSDIAMYLDIREQCFFHSFNFFEIFRFY